MKSITKLSQKKLDRRRSLLEVYSFRVKVATFTSSKGRLTLGGQCCRESRCVAVTVVKIFYLIHEIVGKGVML